MENVSILVTKPTRLPAHLEWADNEQDWVEIPMLGTVSAGSPIDIFPDRETVAVPASVVRKECYALRVKGNSMVDEHIEDGDIIVVKSQTTAENGQVVVALINGEQTTLKKFYVEREGIRLQPANPDMEPIYLTFDQVQILGIVQAVIRQPN